MVAPGLRSSRANSNQHTSVSGIDSGVPTLSSLPVPCHGPAQSPECVSSFSTYYVWMDTHRAMPAPLSFQMVSDCPQQTSLNSNPSFSRIDFGMLYFELRAQTQHTRDVC